MPCTLACRLAPVLAASAFLVSAVAPAATPPSGTVDDAHPSTTWTGGPYIFPNLSPQTGGEPICEEFTVTCDQYRFEVNLSNADVDNDTVIVSVGWNNADADFDPYLYDDVTGELLVNGAGSANPDIMFVPVRPDGTFNGKYRVVVAPYLPLAETYTGKVEFQKFDENKVTRKAVTVSTSPAFDVFNPPKPYTSFSADEPTMGINRNDNKVYMIYNSQYLETEFKDDTSPATSVWNDVTGNGRPLVQADPFMGDDEHPFADGTYSPRIWAVGFGLAASDMLFSDTPGAGAWTRSNTAAAGLPAGVDNESIASGPYPEGVAYEVLRARSQAAGARGRAFYYCAHGGVNAFCIRSDDGGLTYGTGRPIFPTGLSCSNHSHVKVGVDGTAYVPMNMACTGGQGVSVSLNAGETWTYIRVADETAAGSGRWDSSIGLANDGKTLYYGYGQQGTDDPYIVKGTLKKVADPTAVGGLRPEIEWGKAVNVGRAAGLRNIVFATVVAGDPDRAAFAFHGTSVEGDSGQPTFKGVWHLYVAMTYDGGQNWEIQNVTPGDPTQKGGVCDQGIGCSSSPPYRNLLDFMDMVTDRDGRVLVGFADGCLRNCLNADGKPTYSDMGGLARQSSGLSLFAAKDSLFSGKTAAGFATLAPIVTARALNNAVHLSWKAPADRGSPIQGYRILRNGTAYAALSNTGKPYFVDRNVLPGVSYTYQVLAFSALGDGQPSAPVSSRIEVASLTASGAIGDNGVPTVQNQPKAEDEESECVPPGITVVEDGINDPLTTPPETLLASEDIEFIAVAEPGALDNKIIFTLKVRDLSGPLPPQHRWVVYFTLPDGAEWYAAMSNADGPLQFEYGKTEYSTTGTSVGLFNPEGALEPESGYLPDGHIALVLDKSKAGGMPAGTPVDLIYAKTRDSSANPGTQNAGITRDDTGSGLYDVVGNESCRGKAMPVAAFKASRFTGVAPITVSFDAGDSFVDRANGLSIAKYVWDFGDGSEPLETQSATVEHTYTEDEAYRVKLYVIDSNNERSNNAKLMVLLGQDSGGDGLLGENSYSIFGGGLGIPALLALGLFSLLGWGARRRKG